MQDKNSELSHSQTWETFKKWWHTYDTKESKMPSEAILEDHPFFSQKMLINQSGICVIDIKKMQYLFVSENVLNLTGWTRNDYLNGGVSFAFSNLHPDEQNGINKISQIINDYFVSLPDHEKPFYHSYWDYRARTPKGDYNRLLQHDSVLEYDPQGHISILFSIVVDITNYKSNKSIHLRLTNGKDNYLYQYLIASKELIQLESLSKRELEIALLINKGFDSQEIADNLFIAFNTVNTHRRKILSKLNVKDSLELSNLLKTLGFL